MSFFGVDCVRKKERGKPSPDGQHKKNVLLIEGQFSFLTRYKVPSVAIQELLIILHELPTLIP